jgi:hypothetical protein
LPGAIPAGTTPPRYGTLCRASPGVVCAVRQDSCIGDLANPTVAEIWFGSDRTPGGAPGIREILPTNASPANLRFRYTSDPGIGFLGGPYAPIVTVEIENLDFRFVTPLGRLAALAGAAQASGLGDTSIPFPSMSISLPGEDLAQGNNR